jgi:hypothetical protein
MDENLKRSGQKQLQFTPQQTNRRRKRLTPEQRERRKKERAKKRRLRILVKTIVYLVLLLIVVGIVYLFLPRIAVEKELTVEAGSEIPTVSDFLRFSNSSASIVSGLEGVETLDTVAEYPVTISIFNRDVKTTLIVQDTVAPVVTTCDQEAASGTTLEPEKFIASITDATSTTAAFKTDPDFTTEGTHEVLLLVTDEGGNTTEATASVNVWVDTEPPVIEGVSDISTVVGGSVSYKRDVTVTDNLDEDVELVIDNSAVDLDTIGEYTVVYSATDSAGNTATETATVTVKQASADTATEDTINAAADKILASILTDDMTLYEKAEAIYWWCHEKIAYVDGTPKVDYVNGAYRGLVDHRGDCYTYAMTAKCLLTRAGITNMDIERIPEGDSMHYWNLIDIGDGWYHFDTTRRADGTTFFYWTDAEIKKYSDAHNNSHNYDRSKYPTIN